MKESLRQMYERGLSINVIAQTERIDPDVVRGVLIDSGLKLRPGTRPRPYDREKAFQMIGDGATVPVVAREVGTTVYALYAAMRVCGRLRFDSYTDVILKLFDQGLRPNAIRRELGHIMPISCINSIIFKREKDAVLRQCQAVRSHPHYKRPVTIRSRDASTVQVHQAFDQTNDHR